MPKFPEHILWAENVKRLTNESRKLLLKLSYIMLEFVISSTLALDIKVAIPWIYLKILCNYKKRRWLCVIERKALVWTDLLRKLVYFEITRGIRVIHTDITLSNLHYWFRSSLFAVSAQTPYPWLKDILGSGDNFHLTSRQPYLFVFQINETAAMLGY